MSLILKSRLHIGWKLGCVVHEEIRGSTRLEWFRCSPKEIVSADSVSTSSHLYAFKPSIFLFAFDFFHIRRACCLRLLCRLHLWVASFSVHSITHIDLDTIHRHRLMTLAAAVRSAALVVVAYAIPDKIEVSILYDCIYSYSHKKGSWFTFIVHSKNLFTKECRCFAYRISHILAYVYTILLSFGNILLCVSHFNV